MTEDNPWKFNKETYRDRRKKGYHGQVPAPGSPEHRHDARKMIRKMNADNMERLKKGLPDERKKRKSTSKGV